MSLLPTVFDSELESLIVIQTSLATPWLPLIHALLTPSPVTIICLCILHPPAVVLPASLESDNHSVIVIDWSARIPNYELQAPFSHAWEELNESVLDAIASVSSGPVMLLMDSPETLRSDMNSISGTYAYLHAWYTKLTSRPSPGRMVLLLPAQSLLSPRLITPAFSPDLVHLILHPPKLLHHLATAHLAPAPPHPRFWALFSSKHSIAQAEQLVWGDGSSGWTDAEVVVEVLVRRARGRRVERAIEGWRPAGPCEVTELHALRDVWTARSKDGSSVQIVDPTHDLPFNLVLTDAQQRARAQVPLPYAHVDSHYGSHRENMVPPSFPGTILYDPDSADDLDDDDPDEDLDI